MSMDKDAIKQIQQTQTAEAMRTSINEQALSTPLIAVPKDFEIENLERYMEGRTRYRGKMTTVSLQAFVEFCKAHDNDGARCFVDSEDMDAKTFFNLGTEDSPGHADFSAYVKLNQTAEFKTLLDINGDQKSQKQMAEWLEDWQEYITPYSGEGEAINIVKAIAAVRRLEINASRKEDHDVQNFRESKSALESIEARSDHGMPAGFRFTCVPYQGLEERSFEVRLSILTGGDAPKLTSRIRRLEQQQEQMGLEFMDKLSNAFSDQKIETYMGSFSA